MKIKKPNRKQHSYVQSLSAPPERVFPLLCPVAELEWVPGWRPDLVLTNSGVVEPGCVFVTPAKPADAIWIVTHHDPENHEVEMHKVTPEHTVCRLTIALAADGPNRTHAEITYSYTALSPAGEAFLEEFTESWYTTFMQEWEQALNHYLTTGKQIEPPNLKGSRRQNAELRD